MAVKINKVVRHDSLSIKATYPMGSIKFKVNRSGETLESTGLSKVELNKVMKLCRFLPGEVNGQRIDRLEQEFKKYNSVQALAASIQ
ncbi:MAG: hypothetical protein EO766_17625 [Hydrotalea sp. AMD]|uniref:hypothetical protein n=1 Tax=Hydrotalea sp. AMD TaxID=2501297 RepID=UPI001028485B|nr:hypothetical protein [Hydrotalea sp. AMD]RWZ83505.1 MAG: hypothetical protein EO766_17625 [Hydrotalea sp. AMD]